MSDDSNGNQEMASRAERVRAADETLMAAVEHMRSRYRLERRTADIVRDIKRAMHTAIPPHSLSVFQALSDRERDRAFNADAASTFRPVHRQFRDTIAATAKAGGADERRAQTTARHAWKQDAAADRRVRKMESAPPDRWKAPYRGQPERYDSAVVLAFADAIARVAGRNTFARGNREGGLMLKALVAAVEWAMTVAWQGSAPFTTPPPSVKPEGLLRIVRGR
jgi:hypothetical protein